MAGFLFLIFAVILFWESIIKDDANDAIWALFYSVVFLLLGVLIIFYDQIKKNKTANNIIGTSKKILAFIDDDENWNTLFAIIAFLGVAFIFGVIILAVIKWAFAVVFG